MHGPARLLARLREVESEGRKVPIRRSRTEQEGRSVLQFPGEPTVERIWACLSGSGRSEGALFREVDNGAAGANRPQPACYAQGQVAKQGSVARLRYGS